MFRACATKRAIVAANLPSVLLFCRHIGLLFGKRLDTNLLRQRDSKISGFTRPHVIGFVADLFFSTPGSGFKNIRIRCRIRRMRVDGSRMTYLSGKRKLRIQKYPPSSHNAPPPLTSLKTAAKETSRTHFHMKGFALVFKQRHKRTRKWPIKVCQL